jgi:hypothetical protein
VVTISRKSEGLTVDDMIETLKEMEEVGDQYKDHLMSMQAQLFCTMAEEVISRFGEPGRDAIIEAVERAGEIRGRKIAELVKSLGKELDLKNFFIYHPFDTTNLTFTPEIVDGNLKITIAKCPFAQGCKDWGKEEYGKIYCEHIDKAMLRGYNPDLVYELSSNLTRGDKVCVQKYISK